MLFIIQSPYWFTIGCPGVLSLGRWTSRVHTEFHVHRATQGLTNYCRTGLSPSAVGLSRPFIQLLAYPRSLAATDGVAFCFPFLRLLRCISSPGSPPYPMHSGMDDPEGPGFPIQKSSGHSSVTSSLRLIAGSNVFHRLWTPRHPPCALHGLVVPPRPRSQAKGAELDPRWVDSHVSTHMRFVLGCYRPPVDER